MLEQIGKGAMPVAEFVRTVFGNGERLVSLVQVAHSAPIGIDSPEVRSYVLAALIAMKEAVYVNPDEDLVIKWFRHERLSFFENKTPAEVIACGKSDALIAYIRSLDAGWSG